jgi:hypothetical protein
MYDDARTFKPKFINNSVLFLILVSNIESRTRILTYVLTFIILIQGDQKVSVHPMITIKSSGAQKPFDHPVIIQNKPTKYTSYKLTFNFFFNF